MAMTPRWQDVCCASIPAADLPVLADLRRLPGIRLSVREDRAWIRWDADSDSTRRVMIERLLPLPGVEMFARHDGHWYRPGESLPEFRIPIGDGSDGVPLERMIFPRPMTASAPEDTSPEPIALRVVRDARGLARPAAMVCCRLDRLAEWAEQETSARIASLMGTWVPGPHGGTELVEVLVLGDGGSLPASLGGTRYWGMDVMIPLGFRADPELSGSALRRLAGASPDDLVILEDAGYERIPRGAFRPLSRAGIRLARAGIVSGRLRGGRRP